MPEHCGRSFDEALLSGYLDESLTQVDDQRVRLHLEDCAACREELAELRRVREVTMGAEFNVPSDDQWLEAPRSVGSRLSLSAGWLIVVVWFIGLTGYGAWELWTSDEPIAEKLIVFGGWTGFGLLLLGVLLDRLKAMKTDRYREVQK